MSGVIGIFDDLLLYVSAIDAQSFIFNFIGPFAFFNILDGNTQKKNENPGISHGKGKQNGIVRELASDCVDVQFV